ncbi:hypothetical protein ER308_02930 [Egibacter rhizosphaerae]|uniref:Transporter n=1 Tax=Egibacter rhizosphaerae TaxID=1670831 RepID=A0A411YBR4_9ACTN|nr:hypothetical protein [Egibacter rhizosphaerae]QBI18618.1 hypothetical protein ER308_02930 [Egibacter rhizosphaerae]
MALTFVRLKLALLAASFKRSAQQAIGFALGIVFLIPVSIGAAVWLSGTEAAHAPGLLAALGTALIIGWGLMAPFAFGTDETLDPARLRTAPLRPRTLVIGLLAASAIGLAPVVTFLLLAGAGIAVARAGGPFGWAIGLVALVAQLTLCLLLSRAMVTWLADKLRSRRGRDLVMVGVTAIGPLAAVLAQIWVRTEADVDLRETVAGVGEAVSLLPTAWAARAAEAAAAGQALAALGWLAGVAALLLLCLAWWARTLEHAVASGGTASVSQGGLHLEPRALAQLLPEGPIGAACARELRSWSREPQRRIGMLLVSLAAVVAIGAGILTAAGFSPAAPLAELPPEVALVTVGITLVVGLQALNLLGADRGGIWLPLMAGRLRTELIGKHLAITLLAVVPATVAAVGFALATGGWVYVPLSAAAGLVGLAPVLAVGAVSSILAPYPLPDSPTGLSGGSQGQGCATMIGQMIAMLASGIVLAPAAALVAAAVFLEGPWVLPALIFVPIYAVAIWWGGVVAGSAMGSSQRERVITTLSTRP